MCVCVFASVRVRACAYTEGKDKSTGSTVVIFSLLPIALSLSILDIYLVITG